MRRRRLERRESVDAYPLGLLVVTAVSAAILLEPWIGVPLALLSLALLVPLLRRPPGLGTRRCVESPWGSWERSAWASCSG